MSIRFAYARYPVKQPLITLGGRVERPRPVIPVTVLGPSDTRLLTGLLDTGADDTVLPESLAEKLGIDLTGAPLLTGSGVGKVSVPLRLAEVVLRIAGPQEQREWRAWVGFTAAPIRQPLFGYAGFLQFFDATFHGDAEVVELRINRSYRGT